LSFTHGNINSFENQIMLIKFFKVSNLFTTNSHKNHIHLVSQLPIDSPSLFVLDICILSDETKTFHILFDTIPPRPPQSGEGNGRRERSRGKVHNSFYDHDRLIATVFLARSPFCRQPVLKTFTGPHAFFNHQQTPEGKDVAL